MTHPVVSSMWMSTLITSLLCKSNPVQRMKQSPSSMRSTTFLWSNQKKKILSLPMVVAVGSKRTKLLNSMTMMKKWKSMMKQAVVFLRLFHPKRVFLHQALFLWRNLFLKTGSKCPCWLLSAVWDKTVTVTATTTRGISPKSTFPDSSGWIWTGLSNKCTNTFSCFTLSSSK